MTASTAGERAAPSYGDRLADIYEAAYQFKDYAGDVDYLLAAIRARHPGARSLLETAAGTGRYLELLRPRFAIVEGLDLSPSMLARAARRVPGVTLHAGDMVDFSLPATYDVVCCLFRSIAYCRTRDRLHGAIASMARHVAPGGLLLVEPFFTPETYWVDHVTLNRADGDGMKVAWMYVSEREGLLARLRMHFLVGTGAGVEHFEELHELGLFTPADFESAFAAAGLSLEFDPHGPTATGLYIGRRDS